MAPSTPTRDRIVDAAMLLFSERGFRGTSITAIEAAAGLSPGAGSIYHHFTSKRALLEAGIERHLARLEALRDIRRAVGDLGDLRAELTIFARYLLNELDRETELLRILAAEARHEPELLAGAVDKLLGAGFTDFAAWLRRRADPTPSAAQADGIAALALGALLSSRLTRIVLGASVFPVDDETLVHTWVHTVIGLVADPPP